MRQTHSTAWNKSRLRTGSALVLVIGALALIAVFAAIYLSIGRSDRNNAAALKQRAEVKEYGGYISEYVAGVIGDDRLGVFPIKSLNPRDREFYREVTDYPYTDYTVRSQPEIESERFSASGRHLEFAGGGADDFRVPYDPWLASTEPEYLGSENIFGGWGTGARYYSHTFGFSGNLMRLGQRFVDNRDYRQISNLAPDGRFVNLWNLRIGKDPKTNTFGGFDAQPGFGTYKTGSKIRRKMSYGLSLLNRLGNGDTNSNVKNAFLEAFDPTDRGMAWVAGYDAPQPMARALNLRNTSEIANVPAVWTMNQRFLFSPANQPFFTYERASRRRGNETGIADWTSPDLMAYQYADADGDGMYDSRWIELIDASNPNAFKNLLPFPIDDLRLFAAVRVEDLSARVNINASGDQIIAPSREYPIGLTPAEVDLRRLLAMEDFAYETGLGLNEIDSLPTGADVVQNYQEYDYFLKNPSQVRAKSNIPVDFTNYWGSKVAEVSVAEEVGRLAYDSIRISLERGTAPGNDFFGPKKSQTTTGFEPKLGPTDLISSSRFAFTPVKNSTQGRPGEWVRISLEPAAKRRTDYSDQVGSGLPLSSRDKISPLSIDVTGQVFGLDDLAELLTYKGINDPRVMSRLEQATMGRADLDLGTLSTGKSRSQKQLRQVTRRFGPLLSTRPLEIDRFGHADGRRKRANKDAIFQGGLGPRVNGTVDREAMVLLNVSPRLHLTTYSGATPLPAGSPVTLDTQTLRVPDLDEQKLATPIKNLVGSTQITFWTYARTLLRDPSIKNFAAWRKDLGEFERMNGSYKPQPEDTVFYGYRGPELALRLSAHLAVNLQDMVDDDDTPTAATLLVDQSARPQRGGELAGTSSPDHPFPWIFSNDGSSVRNTNGPLNGDLLFGLDYGRDRLPDNRLSATDDGERRRRAVNVFGVEPMPVLTEVAVVNIFTDAPKGAGGDQDSNDGIKYDSGTGQLITKAPGNGEGNPPAGGQGPVRFVTLDTVVPVNNYDENPDFLMQALVFQVHNPYPERIEFAGFVPKDPAAAQPAQAISFSHYLEYAGRFFRLGSYSETELDTTGATPTAKILLDSQERYKPVTLAPGETAVFYALMNEEQATSFAFDWDEVEKRVQKILESEGLSTTRYGHGTSPTGPGEDQNQYTGLMEEWFAKNLADDSRLGGSIPNAKVPVYRIREFSPATGEYTPKAFRNLAKRNTAAEIVDLTGQGRIRVAERMATTPADETVRLWRVMRTFAEKKNNIDNVISNDLLADRLVVGDQLRKQFTSFRGGVIRDTISLSTDWYDPYTNSPRVVDRPASAGGPLVYDRNDNTGWTVSQWAGVRRRGRNESEFSIGGSGELIRGAVSPAMIATDEVKDQVDKRNGTTRVRARKWMESGTSPNVNALEDLAQPANASAKLINSPNFKYRLVDMLRMNLGAPDPISGLPYPPFNVADEADYLGDTPDGPVLQGMPLQPFLKGEGLARMSTGTSYYRPSDNPVTDNKMPKPLVKSTLPGAPDYDLDYISANPGRVNPDLAFGMQNTNDKLRYTIRPTDLLAPFAVGPVQSPADLTKNRSNASGNYDPDAEWITFPEMLSITLGYRLESPGINNKAISQLYGLLWTQDNATTWSPVLDGGKLRLDTYVSFFDLDQTKNETNPDAFTYPGNFTPQFDKRRGTGIPIALELLGEVRGVGSDMREIGYRVGVPNRAPPGVPLPKYSYNERFDARTDMVVGKININTAPASVLRLLPGLSPSIEYYDGIRDSGYQPSNPSRLSSNDWTVGMNVTPATAEDGLTFTDFGTPKPDAVVTANNLDSVRDTPDRAALLIAYRDRNRAWPRPFSDPVTVSVNLANPAPFALGADFTPFASDSPVPWRNLKKYETDTTPIPTGALLQAQNFQTDRTRQILTGIPGLRENPGFSTVGEVLAVTLRQFDAPETPTTSAIWPEGRDPAAPTTPVDNAIFDFNKHNLMSSLGFDGEPLKAGTPSYINGTDIKDLASYDVSIYSDGVNDSVVDEADEKTAIAGAIMNSIDVRSDTFVIWFVLHAYRPEDVANLRPSDPLVPSYQRRFMMVVDRSNVISENDSPKIVLFREVPM